MNSLPNYATNIALIKNGIVVNTIWGMIYNIDEFTSWGYDVIQFDDLNVAINDTYHDGKFYKKDTGDLVKPMAIVFGDQVATLESEINELDSYIIDLEYQEALKELEEQ